MSMPFEPLDPTELLSAGPEEFVATGAGDLLLVDDNPANQAAMEAVLTGLVPRVVKVSSGREALRELLASDFALILLDINMPDMDGFETAEAIRSRARSRHIPIIFLTAYDRAESEILRGYELGAVDFLFKPIVPKVLRSKAAAVLQLHRQATEVARQAEQLRVLERREMRRRLAAEKQRWKTDALREENRRKDGFLAMLAHELRNPLVPIVSGLELIRTYQIEHEGLAKVRDSMERQADRLVRLVDDLIDVSRVSRGKVELRRERLELVRVVHQAIESVRPLVDSRVQSLDVILRERDIEVEGDEVRLTQVLVNLLHNASRYTPPGGSIGLSLEWKDAAAVIRVTDTGRGIHPDMLDHVFEMFVQERAGDEGLGLGLTLVKQLIDLHGGQVRATSGGPGRGAEFEIQLPALAVRHTEQTAAAVESEQAAHEGKSERAARERQSGVRALDILVVEDEADIRHVLEELLEFLGHAVRLAENGQQGLDLMRARKPDVALIDISMPGLDGYGVAERARAHFGDATPRLVALTGYGREEDRRRTSAAGFHHHITKPVKMEQLLIALEGART